MELGREELLTLRAKHKDALKELLQQFEVSEEVRLYKASVGLEHFQLQQVEERHRAEVVALLCYQFSIMGNQLHNTVFVAGVEDVLPRFQVMVDHGIETGLCTVCLDKRTGRVVGFLSQNDILDPPPFFDSSLQTIQRGEWGVYQRMRRYMNLYVARQLPVMDYVYDDFVPGEWELPIKPEVKYGMVMYKDCAAVRPDMGNQGIMQYMLVDFNDRLGYRMAYGIATNPITIGLNSRAPSTRHLAKSIVDVSTIAFPNGLTLVDCMSELVGILLAALSCRSSCSWPPLTCAQMEKQRWTKEYVDSLRERAFLVGMVHLYGRSWRLTWRGRKQELMYRALYRSLFQAEDARMQAASL